MIIIVFRVSCNSQLNIMNMVVKTYLLLLAIIWCVQGLPAQNKTTPVYILDTKYVVVDGFKGSMGAKTLDLFKNVETLVFQNCNFTTFNENLLHPVRNLKKFVFTKSHFARVRDDKPSICCKKLREFEYIDSDVGTMAEEEFKKIAVMPKLDKMNLHKIDVPALKARSLVGSNLKIMEIQHGNLAVIEDGSFDGMSKLEVLNLQHNKLKKVPTASLAAVATLKELNLRGNSLEKFTAEDIPLMPNLEKLNIGHNPIKVIDFRGLKEKLPNIKQVDVSTINIDLTKVEGIPIVKK